MEILLGNRLVRERLENLILHKNFDGNFIFYGPEGVGKFSFAKSLALNFDPHDTRIIQKDSLGIDDIKEINEFLLKKPLKDRKIVIIDNFDLATKEAQNAFLKNLEDFHKRNVIILIVSFLGYVLKTIQSRCQIFKFSGVDRGEIKIFFKKQGYDEKKLEIALSIYPHQPGMVKRVLESDFIAFIDTFLNIKNKGNIWKLYKMEDIDKEKLLTLIVFLIQREREKMREFSNYDFQRVEFLLETFHNLRSYNLNPKIQFLNLLVNYYG